MVNKLIAKVLLITAIIAIAYLVSDLFGTDFSSILSIIAIWVSFSTALNINKEQK